MYALQPGHRVSKRGPAEKNASAPRQAAARQREAVLAALSVRGRSLGPQVRADMETRLGADLSDVHVHTGPAADRAAQAVAARAFTSGSHVVFRRGSYDPLSVAGRRVLIHELAHVLQQRRGPVAGTGDKVKISDPGDRFERQAEATARQAVSASPASASPASASPVSASPGQRYATGAQGVLAVQRLNVVYGGVNQDDVGTTMQAMINPNKPQMGSRPSVRPNWWPGCTTAAGQAWMRSYMVQGHLLNEQVGGPGNTMDNLTPITKSTNSQHHAKVERDVKQLAKTNLVEYHVTADYSQHPTGADLAGNQAAAAIKNDLNANVAPKLAGKLHAEYTAYHPQTNQPVSWDSWDIWNEA